MKLVNVGGFCEIFTNLTVYNILMLLLLEKQNGLTEKKLHTAILNTGYISRNDKTRTLNSINKLLQSGLIQVTYVNEKLENINVFEHRIEEYTITKKAIKALNNDKCF